MIWTKSEIQNARKLLLLPILIKKGYKFRKLEHQNFLIENIRGKLVVKDNYWFYNDPNTAGNTIDFFMVFEKKSFSETMKILCPK
jgi:hypothetical protein